MQTHQQDYCCVLHREQIQNLGCIHITENLKVSSGWAIQRFHSHWLRVWASKWRGSARNSSHYQTTLESWTPLHQNYWGQESKSLQDSVQLNSHQNPHSYLD